MQSRPGNLSARLVPAHRGPLAAPKNPSRMQRCLVKQWTKAVEKKGPRAKCTADRATKQDGKLAGVSRAEPHALPRLPPGTEYELWH